MASPSDLDALAARHTALTAEAAAATAERDDARRLLEEARARARLPVLDQVRVAAPCSARWEEMSGDGRVRHCGECAKDVFDLSALTREEAEAAIVAHAGKLCVRYYQRADGRILTADCPVGTRRRRRRRWLAAGAVAALAGATLTWKARPRAVPADARTLDVHVESAEAPVPLGGDGTTTHEQAPPYRHEDVSALGVVAVQVTR